jgi:hypothetical protein
MAEVRKFSAADRKEFDSGLIGRIFDSEGKRKFAEEDLIFGKKEDRAIVNPRRGRRFCQMKSKTAGREIDGDRVKDLSTVTRGQKVAKKELRQQQPTQSHQFRPS